MPGSIIAGNKAATSFSADLFCTKALAMMLANLWSSPVDDVVALPLPLVDAEGFLFGIVNSGSSSGTVENITQRIQFKICQSMHRFLFNNSK